MTFDPTPRPLVHFTPHRHWINDPNGLIWHDGEYHLFFQHNPYGNDWGNMSWGHAVSTDLVSWTHLPVALLCNDDEHVFSGSAVFDADNTSGLGRDGQPPLVAIYTACDPHDQIQRQALAVSLDRGRTWERYAHNPVLDIGSTEFRDPKVFRHEDAWVMSVVLAEERKVRFYGSDDLIDWRHLSDFGPAGSVEGAWECPDLLRLPVEGDSTAHAWVLLVSVNAGAPAGGSGMQYFVGDFDGSTFIARGEAAWLDHGADFYAAVSYADQPDDLAVIQGWMSNWGYAARVPATDYRGSMTLARRLALRADVVEDRPVLVQEPLLALLPDEPAFELRDTVVTGRLEIPGAYAAARIVLDLEPPATGRLSLEVRSSASERTVITVDGPACTIEIDRRASGSAELPAEFATVHSAPRLREGRLHLDVVLDLASVEVFADHGEVVLTDQIFPSPGSLGIAIEVDGGDAALRSLTVHEVTSAELKAVEVA